jgi:hypothetical protein
MSGVTAVPPDEPILVCYDYGMGGLWGVLMAPSVAIIKLKYPELHVPDEPPAWMSQETFHALREDPLWLDDEPPQGLLRALLTDRNTRLATAAHAAIGAWGRHASRSARSLGA